MIGILEGLCSGVLSFKILEIDRWPNISILTLNPYKSFIRSKASASFAREEAGICDLDSFTIG